ncbi:hypothetical protein GAY31_20085 [Azospirillum brasilense]|nr:hypothetical protein [Azospirillum brasilense]
MPLETASLIHQLDITNPAATDPLAQTDDHIRLIKSTLKSTFPSVAGAVTATHTQLNDVIQLRTDVNALKTGTLALTGGSITGALSVTGTFSAARVQENGNDLLPVRSIVMWWGGAGAIPANWALCDGRTVNGILTPDLRNRFILGATTDGGLGTAGGSFSASATTSANGSHSHTASTNSTGSHSHGGSTATHTLTIDQIPFHDHGVGPAVLGALLGNQHAMGSPTPFVNGVNFSGQGGGQGHSHSISSDGAHSHSVTVNSVGDHFHSVSVNTTPPYIAIYYIMKVA